MKTIIPSNSRPLCRAFFLALIVCLTALWAMPGSALAQIYVNSAPLAIGEYNASGTAINSSLVTGTAGNFIGIAVSGTNLYVANGGYATVNKYDANSGALIAANFITFPVNIAGLAASNGDLFVAVEYGNIVGEYDANSGTAINPNFIPTTAGLAYPYALAISSDGNSIYVANNYGVTSWIGKYSTSDGSTINANFITGLTGAYGLAVSGNTLFISNYGGGNTGTVGEYSAIDGSVINASFITGLAYPIGMAVLGNTLYVVQNNAGGTVSTYDVNTGMLKNANFITGLSSPTTIAVAVPAPPIANAGLNQTVQAGSLVALNGSGSSDPSGHLPLTYAWSFVSQPAGGTAALSNPTIVNPTFTANALGNYVIQLVVTDALGISSAPAQVTISTSDAPPVANAGPNQTLTAVGELVHLNGSGSFDLAGLPITYRWSFVSKPASSAATLNGATTPTPSFIADVFGTYSIQLVVTDSLGTVSSPSTITINFNLPPPIANAGPSQMVQADTLVTLDGSASTDPAGQLPLSYAWSFVSQPSGSTAVLSNPGTVHPTFTPNALGNYVIQLVVTDSAGLSSPPAQVTISTNDAAPMANAGPNQVIPPGSTSATLNGSASFDPAGLPLTYQWSIVSQPTGGKASLLNPTSVTPTLESASVFGNYVIQLVVTDSLGTPSSPSTTTVSDNNLPPPPVANAGSSQSTVVGQSVTLNGSGSTDSQGTPLTYQWAVVSAPSGSHATIPNPTAKITSFTPDAAGTYVIQLVVNDTFQNSSPATIQIMAVSSQTQLIANIRSLQNVIRGLPPSAFRRLAGSIPLKQFMIEDFNAVLLSVDTHKYPAALRLLRDIILTEVDGCATSGHPDQSDWITNCPDQSMVYTPLLNIIAEVQALAH